MDEPYLIGFVTDETPDVRSLYRAAVDAGLAPSSDGRTDTFQEYSIGLDQNRDDDVDTALNALSQAESGTLYLWSDNGLRLGLEFNEEVHQVGEKWGHVRIGFQTSEIDGGHYDDHVYRARIRDLLELVEGLVPLVTPEYVWSDVFMEGVLPENVMPDGRPVPDHIDEPSWITVMSESVIEDFGGRDHVLETPAWRTTEFDTGHVMLVLEDHPYDPEEPVEGSATAQLLGK